MEKKKCNATIHQHVLYKLELCVEGDKLPCLPPFGVLGAGKAVLIRVQHLDNLQRKSNYVKYTIPGRGAFRKNLDPDYSCNLVFTCK